MIAPNSISNCDRYRHCRDTSRYSYGSIAKHRFDSSHFESLLNAINQYNGFGHVPDHHRCTYVIAICIRIHIIHSIHIVDWHCLLIDHGLVVVRSIYVLSARWNGTQRNLCGLVVLMLLLLLLLLLLDAGVGDC
eukprot:TRINITY_DN2307_c0_g1_i1.p2 TRINITY_DN2307_c0_g1~~TRINITY_DN2307_c0_g1_i1.p2  ORF type:complete len:134 (-),score=17.62 TRINITY_DN2307_c0_g1_i1:1-402(-)